MTDGVYSLAESEPYEVARLLIYALSNMYRMQMPQDSPDKAQDFSDIWFPRLHGSGKSYDNHDKTLVYGLTFACEKVFKKSQERITDLDKLPMFCPIVPPFHIVGKVLCRQWRRVLS